MRTGLSRFVESACGVKGSIRPFFPLAVFSVVTLYFLYPIPLHLSSLVLGRPFEDAFESIWYLYWYKHALFDLRTSPLFEPDVFYPVGWDLGFSVMPPLYPALLAPLTALVGHVAAYNLSLVGACVFAAYGVYVLGKALGASTWGSIIAGIAYAFYPNRQVYFGGFLNLLLGSMWLPWIVYGVVQATRRSLFRARWMALAGLAFGLSIAGAWQFTFISTTAVAVFGAVCLWPGIRTEWRTWVRPIAVAALIVCLTAGPLLLNAFRVRQRIGASAEFSFEDVDGTSVSIERLFVPSALNPLTWKLSRETFPLSNGEDGVVSFGYIPALLALLGVRHWPGTGKRLVRGFIAMIATGVILMAGPTLHWWGQAVSLRLPGASVVGRVAPMLVMPDGSLRIPMPAMALHLPIPGFRSFHHFGRWGLIASLGIAVLAGVGLTGIMRSCKPWVRVILGIGSFLCLMLEFNTQPLPAVTPIRQMQRNVDAWLAAQPEQNVIIEYPLSYTMHGQSLYYTIAHGQKIVHGSSILPAGYPELLHTLNKWPGEAAIDLLEEIKVRYILVHAFRGEGFEEEILPDLLAITRLKLVARFPTPIAPVRDVYLFELERE
jgi:hypothetical protein